MKEKINNKEIDRWNITVAKSGVIDIMACSEEEAISTLSNEVLTEKIQWEDSWNVVDIERAE